MGTKPVPFAKAIGEFFPRLALVLAAGSMSTSEVSAMPTVMEPKTNEDVKAQPVPPVSNEPELFAAEVAMEGKGSGFMPIVLIAGLILVVGGTIFYFVKGARGSLGGDGQGYRAERCQRDEGEEQWAHRSEERRVGKECRSRWSPHH